MHTSRATSRSTWWGQALQNNFIALVLAMIVVVPLLASPADSRLTGVAVLAFEAFALLLGVTLLWRSRWNLGRQQIATFLRTGANTPVLLLMTVVVISCVFAPNKLFAVQETVKLASGVLLYFVVAYQFRQSKHLLMLVDTLIFLAVAVSFLTMAQYTLGDTILSGARGTMLFGNQQPLGSLLMILLPVMAVIALTEAHLSRRQMAAQVATVMTAGGLLLAHTRSGWIGGLAGLLVLAALVIYSARADAKKARRSRKATPVNFAAQKQKLVLPLMLALVTIGFGVSLKLANNSVFERFGTLSRASTDASFQERLHGWSGIAKMIEARPWTGWGIGQFPLYQKEFTGLGASGTAIAGLKTRGSLAEQAHNFYLQTAVDLGAPGLILFLAVLGAFLYLGVKRIGKMDSGIRRSLLIGTIGATVAFAIDALSSPSWQYGQVSMFLWLMLGAGVGCMRPRSRQSEESPAYVTAPRFVRPVALVGAAALFALVVLPSATLTAYAADGYGSDGDNFGDDVEDVAIVTSAALLLGHFVFGLGDGGVVGGVVDNPERIIIRGTSYSERSGNDTQDEDNEPGLAGRTMFLDTNNNGILDPGERSVTTDENGNYEFTDLEPGTYRVRQVQQPGSNQVTPTPPDIVATEGTVVENVDFGDFRTGGEGEVQGTFDVPKTNNVPAEQGSQP